MNLRLLRFVAAVLILAFGLSACGSSNANPPSRCFWCNWKPFGSHPSPVPDLEARVVPPRP
ncbi:MAG: hypothetical protein HC933_13855 [Pleurocapsa sp. SU_196_0]|nr:hypothetical protein [Pleurocapsa sp. SU_196_0]